jgi:hypothetical protein
MSIIALALAVALQVGPPDAAMVPEPTAAADIQRSQDELAEVNAVIDAMHAAASRADGPTYFAQFAPWARFVGTDAGEHWSLEQFRAYAEPFFARGKGWTYRPHDRTVMSVGDVFFFDEKLTNDSYGELRGSGVLLRDASGQFRIQQYVLSFTVPNEASKAVVDVIAEQQAAAATASDAAAVADQARH